MGVRLGSSQALEIGRGPEATLTTREMCSMREGAHNRGCSSSALLMAWACGVSAAGAALDTTYVRRGGVRDVGKELDCPIRDCSATFWNWAHRTLVNEFRSVVACASPAACSPAMKSG